MCFIQKHVFMHFFTNQKLLILFNKTDVIGGKSLVKPWKGPDILSELAYVENIGR